MTRSVDEAMSDKVWSIWEEGWNMASESANAHHVADVAAPTFREACIKHYTEKPSPYFDPENLRVWGCRLFDNEADARKQHG